MAERGARRDADERLPGCHPRPRAVSRAAPRVDAGTCSCGVSGPVSMPSCERDSNSTRETDAPSRPRRPTRVSSRPAEIAAISPPLLDARLLQDPRRSKRIRKQDADVAVKLRRFLPRSSTMMRSMPGTARNTGGDRRARGDGQRPPGKMAAHVADGRQRHHRIAQPVRRERCNDDLIAI